MKYFNNASVLHMFLMLDVSGINDIKFTSSPIYAPIHALDDTDTNTPPFVLSFKFVYKTNASL
jgi:hypothetical protein